ncbi:MAG: acylphosphatase [Actinobacteria bacterium]|nr:acylphosphatase [Actinomycetota bacterium]
MEAIARATVKISGRVQGVFFRAETERKAVSLGLGGYVMNMPDGSVKAVFEGKKEQVERAIQWCGKGPRHARVESVSVEWEPPSGDREFVLKYH